MSEVTYHCPECESKEVTTLEGSSFFINTGEFFCHSVKCHDSDSPAWCHDCNWRGEGGQLLQRVVPRKGATKEEKIARLQARIKKLEDSDE